jgi:cytochrome c
VKPGRVLLLLCFLAPGVALAGGKVQPPDPQVVAGERVAARECGGCHAVGAHGGSLLADAPPFRDMSPQLPPEAFAAELDRRLHVVHPRMPRLELDVDELQSLVRYWSSLRRRGART